MADGDANSILLSCLPRRRSTVAPPKPRERLTISVDQPCWRCLNWEEWIDEWYSYDRWSRMERATRWRMEAVKINVKHNFPSNLARYHSERYCSLAVGRAFIIKFVGVGKFSLCHSNHMIWCQIDIRNIVMKLGTVENMKLKCNYNSIILYLFMKIIFW